MSFPKIIIIGTILLFGGMGIVSLIKKEPVKPIVEKQIIQEISLETEGSKSQEKPKENIIEETVSAFADDLPNQDVIDQLFITGPSKLPIVETITYTSRVPWLRGRPAWIADYASHYETTRHFIARSLNHSKDYFTQNVSPGDRFNVLKKDVKFHLLIDISRLKCWFYAIDENQEKILLKTYLVGLGRKDSIQSSGCLTPLGTYTLGKKVAIYKPGTMGYFQDRKVEMIRVFGSRWIPFDKAVGESAGPVRGYGLHGTPWYEDPNTGILTEDREKIGKYDSDGCIRFNSEDIEEIFAVVISKPTVIELVKDFYESKLIKGR